MNSTVIFFYSSGKSIAVSVYRDEIMLLSFSFWDEMLNSSWFGFQMMHVARTGSLIRKFHQALMKLFLKLSLILTDEFHFINLVEFELHQKTFLGLIQPLFAKRIRHLLFNFLFNSLFLSLFYNIFLFVFQLKKYVSLNENLWWKILKFITFNFLMYTFFCCFNFLCKQWNEIFKENWKRYILGECMVSVACFSVDYC